MKPEIDILIMAGGNGVIPMRAYKEDAGYDLAIGIAQWVYSGEITHLSTGIAIAIPEGYYGRIVPRSSAWTRGIWVLEGTIDSGYRGEILVRAIPLFGDKSARIAKGDRIAQIIIQKCEDVEWQLSNELKPSDRGVAGFGSSGQ